MSVRRYLAAIDSQLRGTDPRSRRDILEEFRAHLEEDVQRELRSGRERGEAEQRAIERFGPARQVADRIAAQARPAGPTHTLGAGRVPTQRSAPPRGPGVAYCVLALLLIVLVGSLALTSRQSAPPTIAEFAPQAVEQITDSTGGSAAGRGAGSEEASRLDEQAGVDDAAGAIDVARVRRCVGDPPRQIEDPQSPPCVPYWSGDNGGATWHGVTRDEIRVVDPNPAAWSRVLETFFNRRFEFYGRRIRMLTRTLAYDNGAGDRAVARAVYEQDRAFASITWCENCHAYLDELARLGVVASHMHGQFPETYLASRRPFLWTYPMANDRTFATAGNWYCARLAHRNAVHAGDPTFQLSRRKLGIILTWAGEEGTSVEPMNAQLASCASRTHAVVHSADQNFDTASHAAFIENAILQMKTAGVTTVTCFCLGFQAGLTMRAATNQGYFPEWLMTGYLHSDSAIDIALFAPSEQRRNLMVLATHPMERAWPDHPSLWAYEEATNGGSPGEFDQGWHVDLAYWMLLLVASGIQMAGPHLTPQTFERGLHRARFPNPAHRIMAGAVGFADGDHSMTDDVAEMWWSETARGPYPAYGPGTLCYVDGGARKRIGQFPSDDPFFRGECSTG